jgi:hypothetical protein
VAAVCPIDTFVVGGGYTRSGTGTLLSSDSYPIGTGGREAWYVVMHNIGDQEAAFRAIAYCVSTS